MTWLLLVVALTSQGEANATLFSAYVQEAGNRRGVRDIAVIQSPNRNPTIPGAMAWTRFDKARAYVFVHVSVLDQGDAALMQYLAYHEVCHIYLWRRKLPDSEEAADSCAKGMFFSRNRWGRALVTKGRFRW
jgi:hypothetical protein